MKWLIGKLLPAACVVASLCAFGCEDKPTEVSDPCEGITDWKIRTPADGSKIQAGSTVTVEFCWKQGVTGAGLKWIRGGDEGEINTGGSINYPKSSQTWTVPDSLAGDTITLRLHRYNDEPTKTDITLIVE